MSWRHLVVAVAFAIGAWTCSGARAQELLEGDALSLPQDILGAAPDGSVMLDAQPAPMTPYDAGPYAAAPYDAGVGSSYGADQLCDAASIGPTRPVNWISGPYLRGGVNFALDDELFDADQKAGYGIIGGYRQPLGPQIGGDRFFFDLGGSFQNSYGESTPRGTPGRRITTIANITLEDAVIQNLYENTLEEIRRGSAHAALGWFWGPGLDHRGWDPQVRLATRIGGRVGHARGGFSEERIAVPNNNQTISPAAFPATDTYGGLFIGTEAILLQRQFTFGHFQWTVDGEYASDWIDFGGRWEGTLSTASVTMGFMLSR